jgi:hypothetical protein
MNCSNCGTEIELGFLCKKCEEAAAQSVIDEVSKESIGKPLSPKEAIFAMLEGEILTGCEGLWAKGLKAKWDGISFVARCDDIPVWSNIKTFDNLIRAKSKNRPMDTFECLAWVNSLDSFGWMVSAKYVGDEDWGDWDIPQRFKYDSKEGYRDHGVVSYRRARVLPDKSGIDESTIQGFLVEVA